MRGAFAVGARVSYVSLPETRSPITFLVGLVVVPFLTALFYLLLASGGTASLRPGDALAASLASGAIAATVTVSTLVVTDRFEGTRAFLLLSPRTNTSLWLGRLSVPVLIGVVTGIASSYAILLLSRASIAPSVWLQIPLFVATAVVASAGLGVIIGGLGLGMRDPLVASNVAGYALPLVCGVIAPVTLFPAPLEALAGVLPLTHVTTAARSFIESGGLAAAGSEMLTAIVVGAAWGLVGVVTWKWHERRIVREGASEQVL